MLNNKSILSLLTLHIPSAASESFICLAFTASAFGYYITYLIQLCCVVVVDPLTIIIHKKRKQNATDSI